MVYNGAKQFAYTGVRHVELYDMWTPNNINSDIPVPEPYNCNPRLDYFLEDGTFLRLRNITLGYSLPRKWFKGILDYARIYVTAQIRLHLLNMRDMILKLVEMVLQAEVLIKPTIL